MARELAFSRIDAAFFLHRASVRLRTASHSLALYDCRGVFVCHRNIQSCWRAVLNRWCTVLSEEEESFPRPQDKRTLLLRQRHEGCADARR